MTSAEKSLIGEAKWAADFCPNCLLTKLYDLDLISYEEYREGMGITHSDAGYELKAMLAVGVLAIYEEEVK